MQEIDEAGKEVLKIADTKLTRLTEMKKILGEENDTDMTAHSDYVLMRFQYSSLFIEVQYEC